jgi:alkanesulfonate monooxygenase SsuD/methylene tetrahydromethanopterin reductase-like flavin-dependent oxidoreductase (luciferase family)
VSARRGIYLAPFDDMSDPRLVAELATLAERRGFDGFFLWDHIAYAAPTRALADPWVALSAIACATQRVLLGPLVTPLARRRVHKLARETATLDILSGGRLILGVGAGSDSNGEFGPFGDAVDARERARLLDDGLGRLQAFWAGEFEPRPLQRPRIPIWVGTTWPHRRPMRRAARYDGFFPWAHETPEQLAEMVAYVKEQRRERDGLFEIVTMIPAGADPAPWEAAGATWCLTALDATPTAAEVRAVIDAGP